MNNQNETTVPIKGWGVDATGGSSMRESGNEAFEGKADMVSQQPEVEILHSNERPNLTAVFGTVQPPTGLSGVFRRLAFKYSESDWRHWLSLLFADRIHVVEGILTDVAEGSPPNIFKESGWNARLKYERKKTIVQIGTYAAVATLALLYFRRKKKKQK